MIEDVGMRSVRHLWQRRLDVGCVERKEVGWGGDEDGVLFGEVVMVELRRRRKGRLGRR
jgi:hypothetical protein